VKGLAEKSSGGAEVAEEVGERGDVGQVAAAFAGDGELAAWPAAISPAGPPPTTSRRFAPVGTGFGGKGWAGTIFMTRYYYTMAGKKASTSNAGRRPGERPVAA
jgi:hypothetical protein